MTIREQLRKKIEARLGEIRVGGQVVLAHSGKVHAFASDLGVRIYPFRSDDVPDEEIPCVGFLDQESPADESDEGAGLQRYKLAVGITGLVKVADPALEKPEDLATAALADILAAIGKDPEFDGLAEAWARLGSVSIEVDPNGFRAAANVELEIEYQSKLWEV
ncbi:hypothetical protein [Desulfuromonas sp. TF]|uniref:hypothetical protein n=1 Tax=Desulfuromonas sp. TF TaxID=1232410 RepID=UPI00041EE82C|nr:hypothetical protein [Desulfuromonas sp. TF]